MIAYGICLSFSELLHLNMIISSFICVAANGIILFFFYDWVVFHCVYVYVCVCVCVLWGFPDGASGKEITCRGRKYKRPGINPWIRKIPWGRAQQPTLVLLPGESHGQRSLAGSSSWSSKELDMTEHAHPIVGCYRVGTGVGIFA